jgi:uncharacterized protein
MSFLKKLSRPMVMTKLLIRGYRGPLDRTPDSVGLRYEDVAFTSTGKPIDLRGWFLPRDDEGPGPVVFFVHGWPWNRLGNRTGLIPINDRSVDFLVPAKALHEAGFHVLLFDLRNHGESGGSPPVTYGPREAHDFAGAVEYLRGRPDVDRERIGTIGCSMGGNIILYGLPISPPVKAALAIQPVRLAHFNAKFAKTEFPAIAKMMGASTELMFRALRAPSPSKHDPAVPARDAGNTIVRYVQGTGDQWGTMSDVEDMLAATPNGLDLVRYPTTERYEGYRYIETATDDVVAFFRQYL